MKIDIVIGLGYGDEGKGRVVNHLATRDSTVIRFNGGHQAGHTVMWGSHRHVFSSLGAGTFKGADTYISRYCTFYPPAFLNEMAAIRPIVRNPVVWVDSEALITTPLDIWENKTIETDRGDDAHGSVGVGFGATIERSELLKIYARDLKHPNILRKKIEMMRLHYYSDIEYDQDEMEEFMKACISSASMIHIIDEADFFKVAREHLIFEGAQGVMLDMDYGFFPHVTRSNTTSRNAIELLEKYHPLEEVHMKYVTRAYATRHGNGPFDDSDIVLKNALGETNVTDEWQGKFRIGELNLSHLQYARECDQKHSAQKAKSNDLFITCMDQMIEPDHTPLEIGRYLGVNEVYVSYSPGPDPIIKI